MRRIKDLRSRTSLLISRKLTADTEENNLVPDEWFKKQGYSSEGAELDPINGNGTNNLENLKTLNDALKVRLVQEDFHRLILDAEGA